MTGVFASALAFLAADLGAAAHQRDATALAFSLEPVWAAFFGITIAGDRLGAVGFLGCVVIMAGILLAEPAAAEVLARLVRRPGLFAVTVGFLLAVASAALFGAMTVAIRLGSART